MKELITREQADAFIWIVGALGVLLGPAAALIARKRGENPVKYGILAGGPLVLATMLWHVYNAVEDRWGLDSVAALAINAGIFVLVGVGCGLGWNVVFPNKMEQTHSSDAPEGA